MNNVGQVVGSAYNLFGNGATQAFLYSNGVLTDLSNIGQGRIAVAGINDSGQIVGGALGTDGYDRPFLYSGGKMTDLGTLGGSNGRGYATAINASGQVIGYWTLNIDTSHPFLYSGGKMTDLGTLGGRYSTPADINDAGQIVGSSTIKSSERHSHAFLYDGGKMTDLGTLGGASSVGRGINDGGQVVGWSDGRAFLYEGGKMTDLNKLIPANSGWVLESATGINNKGQIAGWGTNPKGEQHAFLLTPVEVPEPGSLTLVGLGALGLAGYAWRRRRSTRR